MKDNEGRGWLVVLGNEGEKGQVQVPPLLVAIVESTPGRLRRISPKYFSLKVLG